MIGYIIYWLCNGLFVITCIIIGMVALRRKQPMWFYTGTKEEVEQESYTDIKIFNRKNAMMWFSYAIVILIVSILGIFISEVIFLFLYLVTIIGGCIAMMLYYSYIHDKYTK